MKQLLLFGGGLPRNEAAPPQPGANRSGSRVGIWALLLALLCVGRSNVTAQTYCAPQYTAGWDACNYYNMTLINFAVNGDLGTSITDNASGCDATGSGYQDRRSVISTVSWIQGHSFTASATTGASYGQNCQAWVDFNDNGTFESAETVGGTPSSFTGTTTFNISIPATAGTGVHRMRVRVGYYYYTPNYPGMDACSNYVYGEAHDYNVNIVSSCAVTPAIASQTNVICNGAATGAATISATGDGGAYTYSWAPYGGTSATATGLAAGTYTVTVTGATCPNTKIVTITQPAGISGAVNVCIGANTALVDGTSGGAWSSSNTSVAAINPSSGVVTGTGTGTTTISYAFGGCTDLYTLSGNQLRVAPITGNTTLSTTIRTQLRNDTTGGTWISGNTAIANINSAGLASGVAAGVAVISYKVSSAGCTDVVATTNVTVKTAGTGMNFAGGDDMITIPNMLNSATAFTLEFWMKSTQTTGNATGGWYAGNGLVDAEVGGGTYDYGTCMYSTGKIGFGIGPSDITLMSSTVCNTGNWVHVAATWDAATTTTKLYINGVLEATSTSVNGSLRTAPSTIRLGAINIPNNYYVGSLDEVRIWNVVRTQSQIQDNMNCDVLPQAGLAGYYRFDEGVANGNNLGRTAIPDYSGRGNCGNMTGMAMNGTSSNYVTGANGSCNSVDWTSIPGSHALCIGTTTTLGTTGSYYYGSWMSSNNAVASINSSTGVVTAVATGTATISFVGCGGLTSSAIYTVTSVPGTISGSLLTCPGTTTTLSNSTTGGTWSSGNTSIATVNSSTGVVTGVATGSASITYSLGASCNATTAVTVSTLPAITGNTTLSTAITTALANSVGGGVWSSSNTSIATVSSSNGLVSGAAVGSATISYSLGGACTATTDVTVKSASAGLNFDGTNDHVSFSNNLSSVTNFTYEAWVYETANLAWERILDFGGVTPGYNNVALTTSYSGTTLPRFTISQGSDIQLLASTIPLPLNTWTHIAVTLDGSTAKMYINGALAATNTGFTYTPASIGATVNNYIGRSSYPGDPYFQGSLDEVRMWNVTRTQAQIQANMNCDVAQQTGLIAYYRFDQGTPAGTNTGKTSAFDYSGNNNCGTLNNFALSGTSSNYVTGAVGSCNSIVPVQPITGNAFLCSGSTMTLSTTTSGGSWSSSNTSVATVNASTGVVTGVATGVANAYITYTLCGATATTEVTVIPSPATIGGTAAVCMGSSTTLTNSVTGGSWTIADAGIATIDASGVVTPVTDGTTTVSYTLPGSCFTTRELTVNPLPAAITGTTDMCMGNTTTLSSTSTGGAWSSASASIVTVNPSTGVVTSKNEGATNITYTLPTGCYTTTSVNNIVSAISGAAATCAGLNVTLSDATAGGTWSTTDATVAPIDISGIITAGAGGGSATISYTMTSGCYRTLAFGVYTTPPAITGDLEICVGEVTTLANAAAGGTWSSPATMVTEGPSADGILTGMVAGTSTISYSLSSVCRTSVVVTVNAIPQVITGTKQVCPGNTTALATVSTGGAWSSSNALATVNASTGVVTGVTSGTSVISYAFTSTGCARTAQVTVNPSVPAITGPTSVCVGSAIALANSAPNGVSWSSNNTSVATVGMANGVVSGVGAGIATITFTTGTGCIATTNITVGSVPASTGASSVCIGSTTTLSNGMTGGVWSSSNAAKATVDAAGVVTGVAEGPANIIYSAGGCSTTKAINVSPLPSAITGYTTACVGTATTLTSVGNTGTWVSGTTSVATVGSVNGIVSGVSAGTSALTYTVTSTGCTRTATVTVVTAPAAITGTAAACAGSTATMSNTTVGGTWTSGATSVATIDAATGVVTAVAAGTATITYGFGSSCKVMASFTTRAMPAVIGGTASVCMPVVSTLTDATAGGTWTSSDVSVATIGSAVSVGNGVVNGVSTGTANITYTITSTGCFRTAQATVNAGLNPGVISPSGTPRLRVVSAPHTMTFTTSGVPGGTWTSSSSAIATVDPSTGLVTGIAAGNATITYSINSGSCTNVAVKPMTVAAGRDGDNTVGGLTGINLYPNPTTGMFTLETEQAGNLVVFTIDGREVSSYSVEKGATQVFLPSGIAAGIYMCRFTTTDGSTTMIRLVYEH